MNEKPIFMLGRKCLSELLGRPTGRRVVRNIDVANTPTRMFHYDEYIEPLQKSCDHGEEVARHNLLGMVL